MPLFNKQEKSSKKPDKKNKNSPEVSDINLEKQLVVKRKKKVGFGRKKKINKKEKLPTILEQTIYDIIDEVEEDKPEEIQPIIKKEFSSKKKKVIIKQDFKNKTVYLEDTGEKLGFVFDTIYDKDRNIIGFKIKDGKSDAVLSFPLGQFDYSKDGLIFIPGWYTNALKIIEKLEFKDKVSPELTALISDHEVSNEELYDIFIKHDDEMVSYIDDAHVLRSVLANRLGILQRQRIALKDDLMDLTEKRLIKDIDRREFSEDVMKHRRKVNILDINITKCKNLIKRLDNTSFGALEKEEIIKQVEKRGTKNTLELEKKLSNKIIDKSKFKKEIDLNKNLVKESDGYKDKYYTLKQQFEQLEFEYQELKNAIEKMLK